MIFVVKFVEQIRSTYEIEVEAPTEEIAKWRAIEMYQENPATATFITSDEDIDTDWMEVRKDG